MAEFRWHTEEIKKATTTISYDLTDLEEAVDVAGKDPARFGLTQPEIAERKKFVQSLKKQVLSISSELSSEATLAKIHQDQQTALFAVSASSSSSSSSGSSSGVGGGGGGGSHDFGATDQTQMMAIRERQDERLDELYDSMVRVGHMSSAIETELIEQKELLNKVDDEVTYTQGRMGSALRKVDKLLSAAGDKGALFIVVFLILVLIGLVILVFKV